MAHSYVDFRGRYLHMRDSDIVWVTSLLGRLRDELQPPQCSSERIGSMMRWWANPACNCGPGCINLRLDEFLISEDDVVYCEQLLARAEAQLKGFGYMAPAEYLNDVVQSATLRFGDEPTHALIDVIGRFRGLLAGPCPSSECVGDG